MDALPGGLLVWFVPAVGLLFEDSVPAVDRLLGPVVDPPPLLAEPQGWLRPLPCVDRVSIPVRPLFEDGAVPEGVDPVPIDPLLAPAPELAPPAEPPPLEPPPDWAIARPAVAAITIAGRTVNAIPFFRIILLHFLLQSGPT